MQDPERDSVVGPLIQRLDGLHHTVEQLLQMARLERNLIMGVSDEVYWRRDVFTPLLPELTQMLQHRQQRLRLDAHEQKMTGEAALLQMLIRMVVCALATPPAISPKAKLTPQASFFICIFCLLGAAEWLSSGLRQAARAMHCGQVGWLSYWGFSAVVRGRGLC